MLLSTFRQTISADRQSRDRLTRCSRAWFLCAAVGTSLSFFGFSSTLLAIQAPNPEPPRHEVPADVYLNDSFEAADAIARAQTLVDRGRWAEAAQLLQRAADLDADKVIAVGHGQYVSLRRFVADVISKWPVHGIEAYREVAERIAEERAKALADTFSLGELISLFDRYFCTAIAPALADRIGQLAIEEGQLATAERVYRRVVDDHPDRAKYTDRYRTMIHLIEAMRRDTLPAAGSNLPDTSTIRLMGYDVTPSEAAARLHEMYRFLREPKSSQEWAIHGGDERRNRRGSAAVDDAGLLWRYDGLAPDSRRTVRDASEADGAAADPRVGLPKSLMTPVVAVDLIFVQNFREIAALRASSGVVVWRYLADSDTPSQSDYFPDRPLSWESVTFADGRLFAALPTDADPYYGTENTLRTSAFVALDARSGRLLWRIDSRDAPTGATDLVFDSSPLVDRDRVYVVGRRKRAFGFEDCYVYCLSAVDGRVLFQTHLGSASTGTFGARHPTLSIPALDGDTIFVATNLGSVAAVDALTGSVRWLRLYPREKPPGAETTDWSRDEWEPWELNPVIFADGRVIALPTDSSHLLVVNAADGQLIRSIPVDQIGGVRTLYGIEREVACGVGRTVACYDLKAGELVWTAAWDEGERVVGRGVWADDQLLVPTGQGLFRFLVADGQRTRNSWEGKDRGGNVVALSDRIILGGEATVSAYVRRADMWKALRERMAAAPDDPHPAFELIEVAVRSREWSQAWEAFEEAATRMARLPVMDANLARRIHENTLLLTESLARRGALEPEKLNRLIEVASTYSPDAQGHLAYRLRFAEILARADHPERAIELYQQILKDRSLRELEVNSSGALRRGADIARDGIAAIIDARGRGVYAAVEAESRLSLEAARSAADVTAFRRVVESYPNSESAPQALVGGAERLAAAGRFDEAVKWYTRAYHGYAGASDRPRLIAAIADAYQQAGKPELAFRWLCRGAREFPQASVVREGRTYSMTQYRDRLVHARSLTEPPRPTLEPPIEQGWELDLESGSTLLTPAFSLHPATRWNVAYLSSGTQLRAIDPATGKDIWPDAVAVRMTAELLLSADRAAVFATPFELFALDPRDGRRLWSHGEYPSRLDDHQADWEDGLTIRAVSIEGDRLVFSRDGGQLHALSLTDGRTLWSQLHRPAPAGSVRLLHPWVLYTVVQDGQSVICLVDAATGSWIDSIAASDRRPIENLFVPWDDQLVVLTAQSLASYDVPGRKWRWRLPLDGHVRSASVLFDLDTVYLSEDGSHVRAYTLEDGRLHWESGKLGPRSGADIVVERIASTLFVSHTAGVTAIDTVDGRTLWEATTPLRPRFTRRFLSRECVIALDNPAGDVRESEASLYFYDHRNASGLIPADGGIHRLSRLHDLRAAAAFDRAVLIQTGSTLRGWRTKK